METENITILDEADQPSAKKSKSDNGKETGPDESMDSNFDEISILNDSGEDLRSANKRKIIMPRLLNPALTSAKASQTQKFRPGPASRTTRASLTSKSSQAETPETDLANKSVEMGSGFKKPSVAGLPGKPVDSGSLKGDLEDSRFECEDCWFTSESKPQLDLHKMTKHGKTQGVKPVEPNFI